MTPVSCLLHFGWVTLASSAGRSGKRQILGLETLNWNSSSLQRTYWKGYSTRNLRLDASGRLRSPKSLGSARHQQGECQVLPEARLCLCQCHFKASLRSQLILALMITRLELWGASLSQNPAATCHCRTTKMSGISRTNTARSTSSIQSGISRSSTSASHKTVASPGAKFPIQVVDDRYLNSDKLKNYLEKKHPGQWKIQVIIATTGLIGPPPALTSQ